MQLSKTAVCLGSSLVKLWFQHDLVPCSSCKRRLQGPPPLPAGAGLTKSELQDLIYRTVDANGMQEASGIHIRLMVTRGL